LEGAGEKKRKIDCINDYKEYWQPIVEKRNKFCIGLILQKKK
jgi:hypothetical protein